MITQQSQQPWCYLFVRPSQTGRLEGWINRKFNTFMPSGSLNCFIDGRVEQVAQQEMQGLLFVQGRAAEVQDYLADTFGDDKRLVRDHASGRVATIADSIMQPFIRLQRLAPERIRIMPHPFSYYAEGNKLIRLTSGELQGMEGYRIRIARDRCLVTNVGGMSVAIKGIHKETFEEV